MAHTSHRAGPPNGYDRGVRTLGNHLIPVGSILLAVALGLASGSATAAASDAPAGRAAGDVSGSVTFGLTERRPDVPTGLSARVTVDQQAGESGPTQLRRVAVTLPTGIQLGAQGRTASGDLQLCDPGAFSVHGTLAAGCPAGSAIGNVEVVAPSQPRPLTGTVYAGAATPGGLPSVYVDAALDGSSDPLAPRVKLAGNLSVGGDGRLSMVFDEIPAPPFSSLQINLAGGDGALLVTPRACASYAGLATLTAATGASTAAAAAVTIDTDCALPGFSAAMEVGSASRQVEASTTTAFTVARPDRSPRLAGVRLALPSGFLANIGSVPECGLTGAAAAGCPADTRIATVEATVGVGGTPRSVGGAVYLTPRQPGAVAGAHLVVRVRAGDLDLGDLVVPARIDLRPTDAGLTISFDVPNQHAGLDLSVRRVAVAVDRPDFAVNPSSCGPLQFSATVTADTGQSTVAGGQATYDGCDSLPFAPTLQATLTGETQPLGHPNVSVSLNARAGDANLRAATVVLPEGIAADPANIKNACPLPSFEAVICSASTRVGTATARVSLTPELIPGDVYLVRIPGESLPGLGLSFTGRFSQRVLSVVKVQNGRLVTRFDAIPDLPLRRLDMDIFGGRFGPIQVSPGICKEAAVWDASFASHGRQVSSHTIPATCPARPAKRSAITLSSVYGLSWRLTDLGGRSLQSAKLTLPAGFQIVKARASRRQYQTVKLAGAAAKLSFTSRAVIVVPRTKTTRTLALRLKAGSIRKTSSAGSAARRVKIKVRLGFTDGTVQNQTITVRAK